MNGKTMLNGVPYFSDTQVIELTRAEYDALPNSKYTDGVLYCIKDEGTMKGDTFSPIIYSLAEREVGVWVDGKPLYQKTWVFNDTPLVSNATNFFVLSVNNIEHVYNIQAFIANSSKDGYRPINDNPSGISSASELTKLTYALIAKQENNIKLAVYTDGSWSSPNLYITIQYTKTTDNPGTGKWTTSGVPAHHYSTDEQVIGTWVDGKPLYEKSYVYPVASAISSTTTLFTIPGIRVKKIDAYGIGYNEGAVYPIPWNGEGWETGIKFVGEQLILNVRGTSWDNNYSFVITLQYTKTTD